VLDWNPSPHSTQKRRGRGRGRKGKQTRNNRKRWKVEDAKIHLVRTFPKGEGATSL